MTLDARERKRLVNAAYYQKNRAKLIKKAIAYQEKNRDAKNANGKKWRERNKEKQAEYSKTWAKNNPDLRKAYRDKYANARLEEGKIPYNTEYARVNREKAMLNSARYRAKKRVMEFNIEKSDIIIPSCCPVFGFPLETSGDVGRSDASPSLDRIDNKLGYVKGNVIVVSWLANRIKNDATPGQLRKVADFYEDQAEKSPSSDI